MAEEITGFGALKNSIAEQFTKSDVIKVANHFELPPAVRDRLGEHQHDQGLQLLDILEQRDSISSRDLSKLIASLNDIELGGIAEKVEKLCHKHLGYVKVEEDLPDQFSSPEDNLSPREMFNKRMIKYTSTTLNLKAPDNEEKRQGHIRIAMVGRPGDGKSATANTILGIEQFVEGASSAGVTKASCIAGTGAGTESRSGRRITVVDTPGLTNSTLSKDETLEEISRMAYLLREGVDAFVLVRNASNPRFTEGERELLKSMKKSYGDGFTVRCFLVYTRADSALKRDDFDKFIKDQRDLPEMSSFLDEMGGRIIAVDNSTRIPAEKRRNRDVIIDMVDYIRHKTKNIPYTNEVFRKAMKLDEKIRAKATTNHWHEAIVTAVIEVYSNRWFLTEEGVHREVLTLLQKSGTGSVDEQRVSLVHGVQRRLLSIYECKAEISLVYREVDEVTKALKKVLGGLGGAGSVAMVLGLVAFGIRR